MCSRQYLEGLGQEHQVSLQFPVLESLFSCAARTCPKSIFNMFATKQISLDNDNHDNLQLPTPESSTDGSIPSLEDDCDSSSLNLNVSSPNTSDYDWAYPLTPPPLPNLEVLQPAIELPDTMSKQPQFELPVIDLPLHQFEDL